MFYDKLAHAPINYLLNILCQIAPSARVGLIYNLKVYGRITVVVYSENQPMKGN